MDFTTVRGGYQMPHARDHFRIPGLREGETKCYLARLLLFRPGPMIDRKNPGSPKTYHLIQFFTSCTFTQRLGKPNQRLERES
jgi:hypothetical protein